MKAKQKGLIVKLKFLLRDSLFQGILGLGSLFISAISILHLFLTN